ncbi:hypothetical protein SFUMM280S_10367 [Streptomyces fumanus]
MWSVLIPAVPVRAASSASYRVAGAGCLPGISLSVYQASVLHSDSPDAEVKGRGERTCTTLVRLLAAVEQQPDGAAVLRQGRGAHRKPFLAIFGPP